MGTQMSGPGFFFTLRRVLAEDFARRRFLIIGWWLLVLAGIYVGGSVGLEDESGLRDNLFWQIRLLGPLLCGVLATGHSMTRRSAWRTRPWRRAHVLAAKLLGLLLFVWLPAAIGQLVLVTTWSEYVGAGEKHRIWLHLVELLVNPGGWMLAFGALGALSPSLRSYALAVLVAALGNVLAKGWILPAVAGDRSMGFLFLYDALIVGAAALLGWLVLYRRQNRRLALAAAGAVLLLWIPAYGFENVEAMGREQALRITKIEPGPPAAGHPDWHANPRSRYLCASFELDGLDFSSWQVEASAEFHALGETARLVGRSPRGNAYAFDSLGREATEPFDVVFRSRRSADAWRRFDGAESVVGDFELEIRVVERRRRRIAEALVTEGATLSAVDSTGRPVSFVVERIFERRGRSIVMLEQRPRLIHLFERKLDFSVAIGDGGGAFGRMSGRVGATFYSWAQDFAIGRLDVAELEEPGALPPMELFEEEDTRAIRLSAKLENVALDRLRCEFER